MSYDEISNSRGILPIKKLVENSPQAESYYINFGNNEFYSLKNNISPPKFTPIANPLSVTLPSLELTINGCFTSLI